MNAKGILLPIVLLLGATCWLLCQGPDEVGPPGSAIEPQSAAAKDAALVTSTVDASHQELDASGPANTPTAVRDAVMTRTALVPIPDDATWVDIKVIDKATEQVVADAVVAWSDETVSKKLQADKTVSLDDLFAIWRDPEELTTRFGWTTTSNSQGIARVHLTASTTDSTQVTARHGNLYGHVDLNRRMVVPRDGFRVEIVRDLEAQVQVLDHAGRPAAGIPIGVAVHDKEGKFQYVWNWGASATTRGPEGIAQIRHMQTWQREGREVAQWRVRTMLPGFEDEGQAIDLDNPPPDPLVLHLPACGKVKLRVELLGHLIIPQDPLSLNSGGNQRGWNGSRSYLQQLPDADGWARFPYVPLGIQCNANANVLGGSLGKTFAGPIAADAEVSIVLTPTEEHILLTGRLLDEHRIPLPAQKFRLLISGPQIGSRGDLETNAEGRFQAILGRSRKDNRADSIAAEVRREGERPLSARLAGRELRPGTEDLGDLVLQLDALLVAGTYKLDGKTCKLQPNARLEKLQDDGDNGKHRWQRQSSLLFHQDDEGHFEYRGTFSPGRYRLQFNAWNHLPHDPVEFDPGTKDLVIELQEGSPLAASLLVPKGSNEQPQARLIPEGSMPDWAATEIAQPERGGRLRAEINGREDGRLDAQWRTLPTGSYRLEIRLGPVAEPIVQIAGVQIPTPKGGDPRLVDIDLRTLLGIQVIRLFDSLGKPINETDGAFFPLGQDTTKELQGFQCQGNESKVLMPPGATDLMVAVSGYRSRTVRCTGAPLDIQLDAWPTITLLLVGADKLPEGIAILVGLRPENPSQQHYRSMWNSGQLRELTEPSQRAQNAVKGMVELPIGDGPHTVEVHVTGKNTRVRVEMPTIKVLPTSSNVTVQVPPEALAAALEKAKAPAK